MNTRGATICILPGRLGLGGPASFKSALVKSFTERGIIVTDDPSVPGLSAILVFGAVRSLADLKRAQRSGIRLVQRLNGMNWVHRRKFTGLRHFIKAEVGNFKLRTVRRMADRIIYQSGFSKTWWDRVHGPLDKPSEVIHNGVDLMLFLPQPPNIPTNRYRVLMVEGRLGGGYEQGLVSAVRLAKMLDGSLDRRVELSVVGEVPATLRERVSDSALSINWLGVVRHEDIPAIDRSAHLLFSGDINAACPNAVIEALACGLPVVAYDTGAMKELVTAEAGRIVPYGGNVWHLDPPDTEALAAGARAALQERDRLSQGARCMAERKFDIHSIAESYLEVLLGE